MFCGACRLWRQAPLPWLRSSLCSFPRHGCGAPRPLAHEPSGFVASLLAGRFAQQSSKVKSRVKGSGQECPLHTGSGRRFAPCCATAAALPARLPTNCPASSLRSLQDGSPSKVPKSKAESKAADRSVRSTRALVVALLLAAPRLRRSPPACPRTVRLRRFAPCRTVRPAKFQSQKQSQRQRTGVSAPHGLWSSLCSLLRHGCGAPRPLAHEPSGFVASLLAGRFAQQSSKVKSRVKGSGQECPLHTGSGRRFAPCCATAAALPARLPTNCPASSLRSLRDGSPSNRLMRRYHGLRQLMQRVLIHGTRIKHVAAGKLVDLDAARITHDGHLVYA